METVQPFIKDWNEKKNDVSRKLLIIFSQLFASKCIAVRVKMICEGAFLFDAYDFPSNISEKNPYCNIMKID